MRPYSHELAFLWGVFLLSVLFVCFVRVVSVFAPVLFGGAQ
jgi:hypothetical protein